MFFRILRMSRYTSRYIVLIGSIVLVSAIAPLKYRLIPLLNAVGRTLFAVIIVYYVIAYDIMRFVLVIGVIDVLISIGFIYFLMAIRNVENV